jgi:signal transduction histidine kinase
VQRLGDVHVSRGELVDEAARMKQRLARLRSVLDGMRAYAARHKLEYGTEDIKQVIEESVGIVRDGRSHGPQIEVQVAGGVHVEICRPRFVQAMTNLLANAVESYDGLANAVPIAITAVAEEERVVIAVEDHGCGMSEEALSDATVLFTTSKETGTGFGLPLVVKIIESEHGGRLELESRKGHGTTARVFVPLRRPRARS